MDYYAYSSTGELDSTFLASCVAIVVVFTDNTVMDEHRSDPFLHQKHDDNEIPDEVTQWRHLKIS